MRFNQLFEKKVNPEQDAVSPGVQQLKTDQWMGTYKWSKEVAGHDGDKQHAPKNDSSSDVYKDAPVVVGYSDADDKKTVAAMKGKVKQTVGAGSEEPDTVHKHSPLSKNEGVAEGKKCPQCGSTSCTCEPGKCNCEPVEEAHPNSKIYDKCWTGYRKVPGKKRGEEGSCKKIKEDEVEEASIATMRKFFAGDEKAKDPTKTSTMRDFFADPANQNSIKPSSDKVFQSKQAYMRWLEQQKGKKEDLDEANVIYQLSKDAPMDDTEVLVLGGAGRYSLAGLRNKARKEAAQLAKDLEVEHGGAFRNAAYHVKQLQNTLNTIVAAYDELAQIRKLGGVKSKGIRSEDETLVRESIELMEKWTQKYKNSINCNNPKGFSQKAHCAGRKK